MPTRPETSDPSERLGGGCEPPDVDASLQEQDATLTLTRLLFSLPLEFCKMVKIVLSLSSPLWGGGTMRECMCAYRLVLATG